MYYHTMQNTPDVSVIIASHRPAMVAALLYALRNQKKHAPIAIEIIVVTDYPNGPLQEEFCECLWVHYPNRSISKKRNCAIRNASGAICAFIDDDCIPNANWILQGYTYLHNHPEISAVEGKTTIEQRPGITTAQTREYRRLEKPGFRTNNLFFRAAHLHATGGFDERFTVQREDIDLAFSAFSHGYRYAFYEAIGVTHLFRPGERWDLLKNCWNRRFDPLLHKKHPALYRKHIGSPLTPTLLTGLFFLLLLFVRCSCRRTVPFGVMLNLCYGAAMGMRRAGIAQFSAPRLFFETVQCIAAPVVTLAALIYGSLRFRTLLIV